MGLKIAIIEDTFYPYTIGGAEKRYWEVAKRLARTHEVHFYTMQWPGMNKSTITEGVHIHAVCKPLLQLYGSNNKRTVLNPCLFALRLLPTIAKKRFDVIDCNNSPFLHFFAAKVATATRRTPIVMTFHEVWGDYWYEYFGSRLSGFIGKAIETITLQTSAKVVVLSEKNVGRCENMGIPKGRVIVIANGLDSPKINRVEKATDESDVIYVGRLISHKHVDVLVGAVARVKQKVPNIKCTIIGDGPEKPRIESQIRGLNLQDNIQLHKPVSSDIEVFSYLKSSKIFMSPSTREGFGLIIPEAKACGLPVITISHQMNGSASFVKNGVDGFIVELSETAIADKIIELLLNRDKLASLSKGALESAAEYDWETTVQKLSALYRRLSRGDE